MRIPYGHFGGPALFGIAIAGHLYLGRNNMAEQLAKNFHGLYYIDLQQIFCR